MLQVQLWFTAPTLPRLPQFPRSRCSSQTGEGVKGGDGDRIWPRPPPHQKKKKKELQIRGGFAAAATWRLLAVPGGGTETRRGWERVARAAAWLAPACGSGRWQFPPAPGAAPTALGEGGRRGERRGERRGAGGQGVLTLQPGSSGAGAAPARLLLPPLPPPPSPPLAFPPHLARPGLRTRPRPASQARGRVPRRWPQSEAAAACTGSSSWPPSRTAEALRLERGRGSLGAICWPLGRMAGWAWAARFRVPTSRRAKDTRGREAEDPAHVPQAGLRGNPVFLGPLCALSFFNPPCNRLAFPRRY